MKAYAELRVGIVVVCVDCSICGRAHRGILLSEVAGLFGDADGNFAESRGYQLEPCPPCKPSERARAFCVTPEAVEAKRVYRIVDPAADEITQVAEPLKTPKRERKPERVR